MWVPSLVLLCVYEKKDVALNKTLRIPTGYLKATSISKLYALGGIASHQISEEKNMVYWPKNGISFKISHRIRYNNNSNDEKKI